MRRWTSSPGRSAFVILSYIYATLAQSPDWEYLGCYTDSVGSRALSGASITSGDMTNAFCSDFCTKGGYNFAGTEYSQECWCGYRLSTTSDKTPDSDCNSTEACGGSNRLTVYNNPTGVSREPSVNPGVDGYRSLGCYTDAPGARTLATEVSNAIPGGYQNSTVANCVAACSQLDYSYAGLEYYGECFIRIVIIFDRIYFIGSGHELIGDVYCTVNFFRKWNSHKLFFERCSHPIKLSNLVKSLDVNDFHLFQC
ncbi:hypothetical protein GRF29_1g2680333 [Pseudopithomyces chartarum]|uniref:WSC domain-containing protein n=1 Tax=Pseudopithomyces chartarum TaxID=1892770 RepID=A0AAN6M9L6_9PLEO|nr:hypothetical protein GRF29_1g2680333 [Pseudopithomyces chartarum]